MRSAGRTTRIIDPDGDERPHYESSNNMPDLTNRLHEAKSSPEENRELMLRIRQSNIQLGDSRIKVCLVVVVVVVVVVAFFEMNCALIGFLDFVREVALPHFPTVIHLYSIRCYNRLTFSALLQAVVPEWPFSVYRMIKSLPDMLAEYGVEIRGVCFRSFIATPTFSFWRGLFENTNVQ